MDILIQAIRNFEERTGKWNGYEALGRALKSFVSEDEVTQSFFPGDAAMDIMRGKRENLRDDQRRTIHQFLRSNELNIVLDDLGRMHVTENTAPTPVTISGDYLLLYHSQPSTIDIASHISCQRLSLDSVADSMFSAKLSDSEDKPVEANFFIDTKLEQLLISIVPEEKKGGVPDIIALIFDNRTSGVIFSGMYLSLRAGSRVVSAAKVIGLPAEWFSGIKDKVSQKDIGSVAYQRLKGLLSSRNNFDYNHMLNAGFEFIDRNDYTQDTMHEVILLKDEIQSEKEK